MLNHARPRCDTWVSTDLTTHGDRIKVNRLASPRERVQRRRGRGRGPAMLRTLSHFSFVTNSLYSTLNSVIRGNPEFRNCQAESPKGITASLHKELIAGITGANARRWCSFRMIVFRVLREYNAYALRSIRRSIIGEGVGKPAQRRAALRFTWSWLNYKRYVLSQTRLIARFFHDAEGCENSQSLRTSVLQPCRRASNPLKVRGT